jgi:hypothetical protein
VPESLTIVARPPPAASASIPASTQLFMTYTLQAPCAHRRYGPFDQTWIRWWMQETLLAAEAGPQRPAISEAALTDPLIYALSKALEKQSPDRGARKKT